jgi:hypothetical protein
VKETEDLLTDADIDATRAVAPARK